MTTGEIFSKRIRQALKMRKMSLRDAAPLMGVSAQALSKWEKGKYVPNSTRLIELSRIFDLPVGFWLKPITLEFKDVKFSYRCDKPKCFSS